MALIEAGGQLPATLVHQGLADTFYAEQLNTDLLISALDKTQTSAEVLCIEAYDHSYFFIASYIEAHLRFHAIHLQALAAE